jgi:hypothetical protein
MKFPLPVAGGALRLAAAVVVGGALLAQTAHLLLPTAPEMSQFELLTGGDAPMWQLEVG